MGRPVNGLESIDDDVLVYILSFLLPPEILCIRQVNKRMFRISKLRAVWVNACTSNILKRQYPFAGGPIDSILDADLEYYTCYAYKLASKWLEGLPAPGQTLYLDATSGTAVYEVRFVPGHKAKWILTITRGIWDILTIWDLDASGDQKVCQWSLRGALFNGLSLNSKPGYDAILAVSIFKDGEHRLEVLSLEAHEGGLRRLRTVFSMESPLRAMSLRGDLLAISDDSNKTEIWNWKWGTSAILQHPQQNDSSWQNNRCIQVIFAHQSLLVVRAHSIHIFAEPKLSETPELYEPLAHHSFGWIDGVSVIEQSSGNLSILLRAESDDPWASGLHSLDLYTLERTPENENLPYTFPPRLISKVPAVRGSLRCRDLVLGPCGTAVWIQPQERAPLGLVLPSDDYAQRGIRVSGRQESVVVAVFPGPLEIEQCIIPGKYGEVEQTEGRTMWVNTSSTWTSLDYSEAMGKIVLSSSFGKVMLLEL